MASAGNTTNYLQNILCKIAISDAQHDFGASIKKSARISIPHDDICDADDEDTLLSTIGINRGGADRYFNTWPELYTCVNISPGNLFSQLQALDRTLYFIVDTPGTNFTKEVSTFNNNTTINIPQHCWIQNRQVLFDPAGKVTPNTQPNLFGKKMIFAWENISPGMTRGELYPPWNGDISNISQPNIIKNKLFYCKNTIFQILDQSDTTPASQETYCIMKVNKPGSNGIVVANKKMAQRSGMAIAKGEHTRLANDLMDDIHDLIGNDYRTNRISEFLKEHHCPLKRLGDQGQALSCLKDKIYLIYDDNGKQKHHESDGKSHVFVTIDRPALAAAITYGVPIIVFCYSDGSYALFTRVDILTPSIQKIYKNQQTKHLNIVYRDLYEVYETNKVRILEYKNNTIAAILKYIEQYSIIRFDDNPNDTINDVYIQFILDGMSHLPFIDILNLYSSDINKLDIEKIAVDNIEGCIDYLNSVQTIVDIMNDYGNSVREDLFVRDNLAKISLFKYANVARRIMNRLFVKNLENNTGAIYLNKIYKGIKRFSEIYERDDIFNSFNNIIQKIVTIDRPPNVTQMLSQTIKMIEYIKRTLDMPPLSNSGITGGGEDRDEGLRTYLGVLFSYYHLHNIKSYNLKNITIKNIFNNILTELGYNPNDKDTNTPAHVINDLSDNYWIYYIDFFTPQLKNIPKLDNIYQRINQPIDITIFEKIRDDLIDFSKNLAISPYNENKISNKNMIRTPPRSTKLTYSKKRLSKIKHSIIGNSKRRQILNSERRQMKSERRQTQKRRNKVVTARRKPINK